MYIYNNNEIKIPYFDLILFRLRIDNKSIENTAFINLYIHSNIFFFIALLIFNDIKNLIKKYH